MNAAVQTRANSNGFGTGSTLKLLLKREFWENRGGFFWAPIVASGIFLLLTLMGFITGEVAMQRSDDIATINGKEVPLRSLDLSMVTAHMTPDDASELAQAVNGALYMSASWAMIIFGFVVFFYLLGALYDERKDRSVLFWKSLPVSDRETVVSKVLTAIGIGPLLALAAGLLSMLGLLILASIFVLLHGGNPITLLWGPAKPLQVLINLVGSLPVYALWALPTVGWLLFCSAWAKSKPFLWAILIPLFAGIFVTWFDVMKLFNTDSSWFWSNIVGRSLLSAWPGSHVPYMLQGETTMQAHRTAEALDQFNVLALSYQMLLKPELWLGAAVGIALIFAAIRLRRWRDEG